MTYRASCHCGGVKISFPVLREESALRCDCSLCRRKGAIMITVMEDELTIEREITLGCYQFGTMTARHYFCTRCGIYTHHRRRSNPKEFGVNLGCVEGADVRREVPWVDGVNHPSDAVGQDADSAVEESAPCD
ncbi:MAG: GFA family protein [Pseudomonadota bacterium]